MTLASRPAPAATATIRRPSLVSPEVLRQVKLIELRTRRLVNSTFSGEYRSIFKGQGREFAEGRGDQTAGNVERRARLGPTPQAPFPRTIA